MKTSLYVLLTIIFLSSCVTQNSNDRKCNKAMARYEIAARKCGCPTMHDSTIFQALEIIRDTTIYVPVPGQTVHDSIPVITTNGLINSPVSALETTYSRSKAWVENGTLKHTLDQRPSNIPLILPGAIHNSTISSKQTIKVPDYIDRQIPKPLSWWQNLFLWSGIITWWVLIVFLILKIKRFTIL